MALEKYLNKITHADCLEVMKDLPDKCVDLVLTDPPYGIGIANNSFRHKFKGKSWDDKIPDAEYFTEMVRVSKNQIIWGGNYFGLPPTKGFLVWDKLQPETFSSAMCEQAWMSFQEPAKIFRYDVLDGVTRVHPTQKPLDLMRWCIENYSNPGDIILDPFAGSGTTLVAALLLQHPYLGVEMDDEIYKLAIKQLEDAKGQTGLGGELPSLKRKPLVFPKHSSKKHQTKLEF